MKRIFSLFIFISLITAYSVFADEIPNADDSTVSVDPSQNIGQEEIAQTMKNLNDLLVQSHAAPQNSEAFENVGIKRNADLIKNLNDALNAQEDSED